MSPADLALAALGFALGGVIKGATGAGAPVVGVPIVAMVVGVPQAVAIFAVLNLVSNSWQAWAYRGAVRTPRFAMTFAVSGAVGVVAGSLLLARLSTDLLMAGVAMVVFLYIGLRIARPSWRLDRERGMAFAKPVGLVAGLMQGAGGISAPVSVTYLNALRLERTEFVGTIALFFVGMAVLQVPSLVVLGLLDWERFGLGLLAAIPLFGAMPLGAALGRRISREAFDRIVLVLLAAVSLRLLYVALS